MKWFQKFCRNAGLMVHGIKQPIKEDKAQRGTKEVVRHEVDEEQLDENVTLRRTTIEEIETRRSSPGSSRHHTDTPRQSDKQHKIDPQP